MLSKFKLMHYNTILELTLAYIRHRVEPPPSASQERLFNLSAAIVWKSQFPPTKAALHIRCVRSSFSLPPYLSVSLRFPAVHTCRKIEVSFCFIPWLRN